MNELKTIDQEQFAKAVMAGIETWLNTDTTDYDNYCGLRDMARFMWRNLDKRVKAQKRKLDLKTTRQIQDIVDERVRKYKSRYKHFGRLFFRYI